MRLTACACLLIIGVALLVAPVSAVSWTTVGAGDLTPDDRASAAYGAVALPDGGLAWIEMTEPAAEWVGNTWTPPPQYWRVVRAAADGSIIWRSDEIAWQRTSMTYDGGTPVFINAEEWYSPKLALLGTGNLLAYDSAPHAMIMRAGPAASSSPQSWLREIDLETGATVWEREIEGWSITGIVEAGDGGYWASAVSTPTWYKSGVFWSAHAERTYILGLNATGGLETSWRIHTDAYRQYTSSYPYAIAPVAGSDGEYWVYGWRSIGQTTYGSNPSYFGQLRPALDRVNPGSRTDSTYYPAGPETLTGRWCIPSVVSGIGVVTGYAYGRPAYPMSFSPTSDGGALVTFNLQFQETYHLARIAANGTAVWDITYTSPRTGEQIPVLEAIEVSGGYLALLQDGPMIRVSRLNQAGDVVQSVLVGDPSGTTTGKRLTAAPWEGHPYACIITGSTTGFGATGTDALVLRLDDLEDVLYLGSGSLSIASETAYAAEEVSVTATLDGAAWEDASYWVSVTDDDGTLYETWDLAVNESTHTIGTHPAGNYTIALRAYSDEFGVSETFATAPLQRLDMGTVEWDRGVAYLGEQVGIGYSYMPDYLRYSYWIQIRDPENLILETYRLPTEGPILFRFENLTTYGDCTAELYAIRKLDDAGIHGNTSTCLLSADTWLYGRVADLYHISIPGAEIRVQQPSHTDPEVAGTVLIGIADASGDYEVFGLVPGYPAEVTASAGGYHDHVETIGINVSGRIHYPVYMTAIPPPPLPEIVGKAVYPPRNHPAEGVVVVLQNSTTTLTEVAGSDGYFAFPPLTPDVAYQVYARNATGHQVSEKHTYALSRGQTVDLLLQIRDESLLPRDVAFSADPISGGAPLRVTFTATGEGADTFHWDFGDGATGTGQSVSHAYGPGLWSVTLTAENYYGIREVARERLISVSGSGGVPAVAPTRFVIQTYSGQPLDNVNVTATPLESTGPWSWLYDLFGISGDVDLNGTVLSGTTGADGAIVFPMVRTVKYLITVTDASREIDTEITLYPHEDEVVISVWPVETPGPAGDFQLYAEEEGGGDSRVGVRYESADLIRITFVVEDEAGVVVARRVSTAPKDDLSHLIDGAPREVFTYGYVAETRAHGELRQDQYIRFAGEARPWIDFAPWIPLRAYHWAAIAMIVGFSWTFVRGEIRGALLTIPILAGTLWVIGWLQVPWLLVGVALVLGILIYTRMSEGELQI